MSKGIDKKIHKSGFVSEIDKFFHDFDLNRTDFPESRKNEVKKYQSIFNRRDHAIEEAPSKGWQDF
jgi:hypothetical protein